MAPIELSVVTTAVPFLFVILVGKGHHIKDFGSEPLCLVVAVRLPMRGTAPRVTWTNYGPSDSCLWHPAVNHLIWTITVDYCTWLYEDYFINLWASYTINGPQAAGWNERWSQDWPPGVNRWEFGWFPVIPSRNVVSRVSSRAKLDTTFFQRGKPTYG